MARVFLITGCSSGFGQAYTQEVLNRGDYVIATARNPSFLSFKGTDEFNFCPCRLDVTDDRSIEDAFVTGLKKFGRVDVVCNNAGYGLNGLFESLAESQIRQQIDVNFFGVLAVTRIALATMREKQSPPGGMIQQISSITGQLGFATYSMYCASKWAVEGFTEALAQEVNPEWNVRFTCIEPGSFPTDGTIRSMVNVDPHPAYTHFDLEASRNIMTGKEPGDTNKAAQAMYELAVMKEPPLRAVLGSDAYTSIMYKLDRDLKAFAATEGLARSTDKKVSK